MITALTVASFCRRAICRLKASPISWLITLVPLKSSKVRTAIVPSSRISKWTVGPKSEPETSIAFGTCPPISAARNIATRDELERNYAHLRGLQVGPENIERALVVAKPIRVPSDAPVFVLEFDDVHPYSVGVFREMGLAFGQHNDFREIPDEMLLGERVETTGEQAYFNEIKRIIVVRSAAVVVGVFSDFINPP